MSDMRLGELIESIATHHSALTEARTELVERLEDAFDGEGHYDFTWLDAGPWEIVSGDGYLQRAWVECAARGADDAIEVWRGLHPDYVFVQSTRKVAEFCRPFIIILRASHEKKAT